MSADNVTPIRARVAHRSPIATVEQAREVWQLRAQVLEHVKAIESLCERICDLPHVWGVCAEDVPQFLNDIEAYLTPDDDGDPKDDPRPGGEGYSAWRRWREFRAQLGEEGPVGD